jgi:hypothetical protein
MMRRLPTLCPRGDWNYFQRIAASRLRLETSPLQFALDDIVSYLKREHGERRPTDDRGSRQDPKRRHLNLQRRIRGKPQTNMNMKWSWDKGIAVRLLLLRYFAASRLSEACKSSTTSAKLRKNVERPAHPAGIAFMAYRRKNKATLLTAWFIHQDWIKKPPSGGFLFWPHQVGNFGYWPFASFRGRAAISSILERSGHRLAGKIDRSVANDPGCVKTKKIETRREWHSSVRFLSRMCFRIGCLKQS